MNKKGMEMLVAMDAVGEEMLMDALPPGMGVYKEKQKSHRLSGFFERPWVAAVISAAVAVAVLTGIVWAGQRAGKSPAEDPAGIGGNPLSDADPNENTYPVEFDTWPDYDNPPVPEDAKLVISSGGYSIAPEEYIIWKDVWNPEKGKMEEVRGDEQWVTYLEEVDSGADASERREILQNLPRVPFQRGNFSAEILHPTLQFYAVSAYDDDLRHAFSASLDENFDSAWSLEEVLEQLAPGSYGILLIAYDKGNYIEAADDYEDAMYEFLFIVDIYDQRETEMPIEPPVELPEIQAAMGMELWAGDSNSTYQQLRPFVTYAYRYDDEKSDWEEATGYGVMQYLKYGWSEFPVFTYTADFKVYFKPVDGITGEAILQEMTIYNNDMMTYQTINGVQDDLEEIFSGLSPGNYLVTFMANHWGRWIDGQREEGYYEYAFQLMVHGESETSHPTIVDPLPDDVYLNVNGKKIYPAGRNEWAKDDVYDHLGVLPAIHDVNCTPVYPDSSYSLCILTIYKLEGGSLAQVYYSFNPDFSVLQGLGDGDYCVVFSVQHPDTSEDGVMLLRSYAFLLYVGYEAATGAVGTYEPETIHPTEYP